MAQSLSDPKGPSDFKVKVHASCFTNVLVHVGRKVHSKQNRKTYILSITTLPWRHAGTVTAIIMKNTHCVIETTMIQKSRALAQRVDTLKYQCLIRTGIRYVTTVPNDHSSKHGDTIMYVGNVKQTQSPTNVDYSNFNCASFAKRTIRNIRDRNSRIARMS